MAELPLIEAHPTVMDPRVVHPRAAVFYSTRFSARGECASGVRCTRSDYYARSIDPATRTGCYFIRDSAIMNYRVGQCSREFDHELYARALAPLIFSSLLIQF